jgi:hypothetical protein
MLRTTTLCVDAMGFMAVPSTAVDLLVPPHRLLLPGALVSVRHLFTTQTP